MKAAANHVPVLVRIPPPLLFVGTFIAGMVLQRLVPLPVPLSRIDAAGHVVGVALLACAVLLALSCVGIFLAARTTLIPFGKASHLITRGPYRFTRNPMYLSLTTAYLAFVSIFLQWWPLLLLPLPVAALNQVVIPFEEARLRGIFGDAFQAYCASVRRWI